MIRHLKLKQSTSQIEVTTIQLIDKLYALASSGNLDAGSVMEGNLQCSFAYVDAVNFLTTKYPNLFINVTGAFYIRFFDDNVKSILLSHWGDGIGITEAVAGSITGLQLYFKGNTSITKFNELKYFTGLTTSFYALNYNDSYLFMGCTSLTEVTIPPNLLKISGAGNRGDFYQCTALTTVTFTDDSKCIKIESAAFYQCTALTTINLPYTLQKINDNAFYGCTALKTITFPVSLQFIDYNAFMGCTGLTDVDFSGNSLTQIAGDVFNGCTELVNFALPTSCTVLGDHAFLNCTKLKSFDLSHINSFGNTVFQNCAALTVANLNNDVQLILTDLFHGCTSLTDVTVGNNLINIYNNAFYGCTSLVNFTTTSTVWTTISSGAFQYCTSLVNFTLPSSVTTLQDHAFFGCTSLKTIDLSHVTSMSDGNQFNQCKSLESIVLGEGLTAIYQNAFTGCHHLTSIILPSTLITLKNAFDDCIVLASIKIPKNVSSMVSYLFYDDVSLTHILFQNGTASLSVYSQWARGVAATTVVFPARTSILGSGYMDWADNVKTLYFKGTTPPTMQGSIGGSVDNIYVPTGCAATYKAASNWSSLASKISEYSTIPAEYDTYD